MVFPLKHAYCHLLIDQCLPASQTKAAEKRKKAAEEPKQH